MPDEPKKPISEEQIDWEEELPEWKDEPSPKVGGADELLRQWEREQYEKFHPEAKRDTKFDGVWKDEEQPLETVRASSWHGAAVPETEWLDHRKLIPMESSSFFVGATKIGKTFVALSAAIACVSGTLWMNEPIRKGPVLFYSAEENMKVLHSRVAKICFAENLHLNVLDDLHFADLSHLIDASLITGNNRTGSVTTTPLYKRLDLSMSLIKPVAVWLDNRGLLVTGNENDRTIAASAMRAFQLLATKHKCAIIMIAHPSKTGESDGSGSSGSTAWFATGRSVLLMEKPEEAEKGVRVITNTMTNYGEGDSVINVKWEFDRFKCTDAPKRADDTIGKHDKAEKVFLKLLRWHASVGLEVSPNKNASNYGPVLFEAHQECEKLHRKWFKMAMDNLLYRKMIEVAERGPPSKRVKYLREVNTTEVKNEEFAQGIDIKQEVPDREQG